MKVKKLRIIFSILCILNILFIFLNSLMTGNISSSKSTGVRAFLNSILTKIGIPFKFTDHFVRKAAHFTEFMLLGILLAIVLVFLSIKNNEHIFTILFIGLLTAVTDEFIQLFIPGRSGQVSDVVLDFTGFCTGFLLSLLFWKIRNKKRNKQINNKHSN